jgi:hypothetical protein
MCVGERKKETVAKGGREKGERRVKPLQMGGREKVFSFTFPPTQNCYKQQHDLNLNS